MTIQNHLYQTYGNQRISFSTFMETALYHPTLGFYSNGALPIGQEGHFTTAPEISPTFSQSLARFIIKQHALCDHKQTSHSNHLKILEFGAGLGTMATDLLLYLEQQQSLPTHYYIMELSPFLRQQQQKQLQNRAPQLLKLVSWIDTLPEQFDGIVLANEVLDALPFHLITHQQSQWKEKVVQIEKDHLKWSTQPLDTQLQKQLNTITATLHQPIESPYHTEIHTHIAPWVAAISHMLNSGLVILIDYGFEQASFYAPERHSGTALAHYQHKAHDDLLAIPGQQDLTCFVNFTAVAEAALAVDMQVASYQTQGHFLLDCGITDEINQGAIDSTTIETYNHQQSIKQLIFPDQMGEKFKAMVLTKNLSELTLNATHDLRHLL